MTIKPKKFEILITNETYSKMFQGSSLILNKPCTIRIPHIINQKLYDMNDTSEEIGGILVGSCTESGIEIIDVIPIKNVAETIYRIESYIMDMRTARPIIRNLVRKGLIPITFHTHLCNNLIEYFFQTSPSFKDKKNPYWKFRVYGENIALPDIIIISEKSFIRTNCFCFIDMEIRDDISIELWERKIEFLGGAVNIISSLSKYIEKLDVKIKTIISLITIFFGGFICYLYFKEPRFRKIINELLLIGIMIGLLEFTHHIFEKEFLRRTGEGMYIKICDPKNDIILNIQKRITSYELKEMVRIMDRAIEGYDE